MKIFHVGSHQFRESLRELLRELWFSYCSSRGMPFREWNFVFREWNFKFRELLREYPGTLQELREWLFHSESVFPEIGVVPRLLKIPCFLRCEDFFAFLSVFPSFPRIFQGKTKGQQLKGQNRFIVVAFFSHFFPQALSPSKQRALTQGEQKRRKDNKKNWTNRCCTLVVACLSSS